MDGLLEFIEGGIKSLKAQAIRQNRNPDQIKTVTMIFPQVSEGKSNSDEAGQQQQQPQRFPLTRTIEEIGKDI
jgi:hypothetical protein